MSPSDSSWREFDVIARPAIRQGASTLGAQGYVNLYDNIWTDGTLPIADQGIAHYLEWLGLDHTTARARVSDHAPVYIVLGDTEVNADTPAKLGDTQAGNCIALKRGSLAALDELEHVGPSRAQEIIARGPWDRLPDLTRVSGLSDARLADIADSGMVCSLL